MKQVEQTKKVKDLVMKAMGSDSVDFEKLAVFEAVAVNTLPLSKAGVYNGAVITKQTLKEMESALNKENFVPLHLNHQQGRELPVGRTFYGKTSNRAGKSGKEITDLNVLFYISNGTALGSTLIDNLDTGIINEVSIGMYPKTVKCSKCEFDYIKDGTFLNWIDASCANGHKIGDKGVHAVLDGLDRFMELSLVSIGAADHARIKPGSSSILASLEEEEDNQRRLAASNSKESLSLLVATKGTELNMIKLNATEISALREDFTQRGHKAIEAKHTAILSLMDKISDDMSVEDAASLREEFAQALAEFTTTQTPVNPVTEPTSVTLTLDALVEAKSAQKIAESKVVELSATNADLQSKLQAAQAEIATLTSKQANFDALTTDNNSMKEFLKLSCQSLLIASGINNGVIPESTLDLITTIKSAQTKLSKLPVGGLGVMPEALKATGESKQGQGLEAYRTKRD